MEYLGCEEIELKCPLLDMTKAYIKARYILDDLEHDNAEIAVSGDVLTPLSEIFDGDHIDNIIKKELKVYLIELRGDIRAVLEQDEKEQLGIKTEEEDIPPDVAYINAIPKNDYRRQQNTKEEESDAERKEPDRGTDQK